MGEERFDNQFGVLGQSLPSATAGTSQTYSSLFASAPDFSTLVAGQWIKLILDAGLPTFEVVYLTSYTAGSVAGTITRAAEVPTLWPAVAHSSTGTWTNGPTAGDFDLASDFLDGGSAASTYVVAESIDGGDA